MGSRPWLQVVLVSFAAVVCGCAWALSSPIGSSPDDSYHQTTIWCVDASVSTVQCTEVGETATGGRRVEVPAIVGSAHACFAFSPEQSAACQGPLWGVRMETESVDNGDYPGGYYRVMHLFVTDNVARSILSMRLFNVVLAVLLLGSIALVTTSEIRRLMTYTLAPVLIPLGWFITASINPSSWALTGLAAYSFALHTLLSLDSMRPRVVAGLLGAVGLLMALVARGDASVFAVIATGSLFVLHGRRAWEDKRLLAIPVLVGAVSAVMALSSAQVSSIAGADAETGRTGSEVAANLLFEFPVLISGAFGYGFRGGLGWLDTPVPAITAYPLALILGFLFFTGVGKLSLPKAIAGLMVLGPMLAIPLMTLYRARLIVGESVQPRYILPLMPLLLAIALTGLHARGTVRLSRAQAGLIWVSLTAANAAALLYNLRRYTIGTDGPSVPGQLEWWWTSAPSPGLVILAGTLGFALFALPFVVLSGAGGNTALGSFGANTRWRENRVPEQQYGHATDRTNA